MYVSKEEEEEKKFEIEENEGGKKNKTLDKEALCECLTNWSHTTAIINFKIFSSVHNEFGQEC